MKLDLPDELVHLLAEALAPEVATIVRGEPEPWVGVARAAEHLDCKPQRIYNLVHAGAIPHRKDGSRLLFKLSELDVWLRAE